MKQETLEEVAERLKGKELFKESNDRARKILSEIKSLPIQERYEKYSERFDNKDNEIVEGIFNPDNWGRRLVKEKPKQETIEEVAERILANNIDGLRDALKDDDLFFFYKGVVQCYGEAMAKWQQERSYSEEDMLKSFIAGIKFEENTLKSFMTGIKRKSNNEQTFEQNFKQFIKQIRL
jgi:hypothetical protein